MRLSALVTGFVLLPILSAIAVGCEAVAPSPSPNKPTLNPTAPVTAVLTLGRLEPDGEVIKLSVPNAQDSRVDRLLVKEGDRVRANQVIAILQGIDRRAAEVRDAAAEVALRTAELEKAQTGDAKYAQITAQAQTIKKVEAQLSSTTRQRQAAITSAKARLRNARQDYVRKISLVNAGAIPRSELDKSQEEKATAIATLTEREAELQQTISTWRSPVPSSKKPRSWSNSVEPIYGMPKYGCP
jgi:HlyD family secretion protein